MRRSSLNDNGVGDGGIGSSTSQRLSLDSKRLSFRSWSSKSSDYQQRNPMIYPKVKMVRCKRWEEINECVNYQIQLADTVQAPTLFRFLNAPKENLPQKFGIHMEAALSTNTPLEKDIFFDASSTEVEGTESTELQAEDFSPNHTSSTSYSNDVCYSVTAQDAMKIMNKTRPSGCTPLTKHILEIQKEIKALEPQLRKERKRVSITIATDGLPTDDQGYDYAGTHRKFVEALRLLEGLPVWIVIRLCTAEYHVVKFYNDLDNEVDLPMDVLDDFKGEAYEVYHTNPWLNYALPLHRLREMGYHDRTFDLIDERLLTKSELYDFCVLLFGRNNFTEMKIPHPSKDWIGFTKAIRVLQKNEMLQWNPLKGDARPWINIKKLNRIYGSPIWKKLNSFLVSNP